MNALDYARRAIVLLSVVGGKGGAMHGLSATVSMQLPIDSILPTNGASRKPGAIQKAGERSAPNGFVGGGSAVLFEKSSRPGAPRSSSGGGTCTRERTPPRGLMKRDREVGFFSFLVTPCHQLIAEDTHLQIASGRGVSPPGGFVTAPSLPPFLALPRSPPMRLRTFALLPLLLAPSPAIALTYVVGFGDSITSRSFDPFPNGSYLDWLGAGYVVDDVAAPARFSEGVLSSAQSWLGAGNTADLVIIMTGTPDAAQAPGFFGGVYDLAETVANVAGTLALFASAGIPTILMAPPPTLFPCDGVEGGGGPTCAQMDARLYDISVALAALSIDLSVPFLDTYALFRDYDTNPSYQIEDLFKEDGVHPSVAGDQLIANALYPTLQQIFAVPEATTALLLGAGLVVLVTGRRRAA